MFADEREGVEELEVDDVGVLQESEDRLGAHAIHNKVIESEIELSQLGEGGFVVFQKLDELELVEAGQAFNFDRHGHHVREGGEENLELVHRETLKSPHF